MSIRAIILCCLVALGVGLAPADAPPNVLFIISDDLSAEALSSYGNLQCETPNIDRLAERGVRFTRAYTQYPVCGPSRAAIMSGMYPASINVLSNGQADRFTRKMGERPSMTEFFKRRGYYTARASKIYHMRVPGDITAGVDGPDHLPSWTERFNFRGPEWMSSGEHIHLTNETLNRDPEGHYGLGFGGAFYVVKGDTDGSEQPDVRATDKVIELMGKHQEGPFFIALGFVRPHVPLVAPASYYEPYPEGEMQLPPRPQDDWDDIPKAGISKNSDAIGLDSEEEKWATLSAYYASVAFMDAQVGRVLAALEDLGLRENTIVVFTSDHGYHLGEHEFWQKMSLHEESVRIPLVISAPGIAPSETDSLAQQIDLYPTFVDLAGFEMPEHIQGKSLAPVLTDPDAVVHDAVYTSTKRDYLITTKRWSYMKYDDGSEELYDLEKDRRQFFNLAGVAAYGEVLADMRAKLAEKEAVIGNS